MTMSISFFFSAYTLIYANETLRLSSTIQRTLHYACPVGLPTQGKLAGHALHVRSTTVDAGFWGSS